MGKAGLVSNTPHLDIRKHSKNEHRKELKEAHHSMSAFFPLRFTTPINSSPAGHRGVHKRDARALDNLLYAGYTNTLDQYQDPQGR